MKSRYCAKEKLLSFGAHPEAKVALRRGVDPGAREKAEVGTIFEAAARAWHKNRVAALDTGHAARLMARLERDALPAFGGRSYIGRPAPIRWRWCGR